MNRKNKKTMKRYIIPILVLMLCAVEGMQAQKVMDAPTIMIVPAEIYCNKYGFVQEVDNNGTMEVVPDYEKALSEDPTLHDALMQVKQLITDRNPDIDCKNLFEVLTQTKSDAVMAASQGHNESLDEAIIRNSMADVIIKVYFDLLKNGPQYQVSYTLEATDAYTGKSFAPYTGKGAPSTSANPVVLLSEAIYGGMDDFLNKILVYYSSMRTKGRMIGVNIYIASTSNVNLKTKVGEYSLLENIQDFIYDHSVEGNGMSGEVKSADNMSLSYPGLYIPLSVTVRGRQMKNGAQRLGQSLISFLEEKGIEADYNNIGLGKLNIYIK